MLEKTHKDEKKYVSCIKINGVPILPPVITSAKRKELLKYKHQAIKLEKRLKRERELREYISRYYLPKLEEANVISESLEHKLSFFDDDTLMPALPCKDYANKNQSKLSCDLQVSQYMNNEFKVLTSFENRTSQIDNVIHVSPERTVNEIVKSDLSEEFETEKPRLIRSNSYVLETPSPMLLEHLKRCTEKHMDGYPRSVPTKEIATSTPNEEQQDKLNLTKSDFLSDTESELKNISDTSTQDDVTVLPKDISPVCAKQTDEIIENHLEDHTYESSPTDVLSISISSIKDLSLDPNDQDKLTNILNAIPESYSKQIIELLEKQRQEQMLRLDSYMKIKETFLTVGEVPTIIDPPMNDKAQTEQTVYYTPESFIISPEKHENKNFNIDVMNGNDRGNCTPPKTIAERCEQITVVQAPKNCMRKLFACPKGNDSWVDRKNWAAAVIQSRVRGYLTRRLLRTERVQGLIQTIKEALICAMELHSENVDTINESDVELHRRLIQQVSAAVYAFYDVFFTTTTSEQMAIIRIDRERMKEKLKRPRSKGSSNRSSRSARIS